METSLIVTLSNPTEAGDDLFIEQKEWGSAGEVTKATIIKYIGHNIYDLNAPDIDCGSPDTELYVYKWDDTIEYTAKTTRGTITGHAKETILQIDSVSFSNDSTARLKYPLKKFKRAEWSGDCFDADGGRVRKPSYTIDGNDIELDKQIYGELIVEYYVERDVHFVTLVRADDAEENQWSSVFYVYWNGGVKWHEIQLAPDSEDSYDCRNGYEPGDDSGATITGPDDPERTDPLAPFHDKEILVDYCTQEVTWRSDDE